MEKRYNRRSAWGDDDQIGAMNYVTPESLVRLFRSVRKGRIYDLGQVIELTHARYGLDGGKFFRVTGVEPNAERRRLLQSVWG